MKKHEFNLYPEMNEERYSRLRESIKQRYDESFPIVLYQNKILDGWNRYKVCKEFGLEFPTTEFKGTDLEAIKFVIRTNNRRDLTEGQRACLADEYEPLFSEKAKERQGTRTDLEPNIVDLSPQSEKSRDQAGDMFDVSGRTVSRVKKVKKEDPELYNKVRLGEETAVGAEKKIKERKRKQEIQEQKEKIESGKIELPKGMFEIIVVDPPWNYETGYDSGGRRVASPYVEMSQQDLLNIELPSSDDCVLFLWTTHRFIWDAKELLDNWGFEYRTTLVWDKQKIGMGDLFRMQCEFCLIGIKGKPTFDNDHTHRDLISSPRRKHSQKPEEFYQMINKLCIGRKLDYFAREERDGWEVFGCEL